MINEDDSLIYITNEKGKEEPYKILKEFENPENHKHFIFYQSIEDNTEQVFVAVIIPKENGEGEITDVDDEKDMAYCQEIFDEYLNELDAEEVSDKDSDEEEKDEGEESEQGTVN